MNRLPRFLFSTAVAALVSGAAAPRPAEPAQKTEIWGDSLDSRPLSATETITVFSGNVIVNGTNLRITCDKLVIVSVRIDDKSQVVAKENRFKSLVATGKVKILQIDSNREATCGKAEVLPGEERIVLTENPMVIDRDEKGEPVWTTIGDELLLLRGEGRVQGRNVRIIGPPVQDLGFDKSKAGAPAAAPKTGAAK